MLCVLSIAALALSGAPKAPRARVSMRATPAGSNGAHLSIAQKAELAEIAALVARPGKGLSACDEGPATVGARFEKVGIVNSEETRRAYRQMLFETPGCEKYLSGAILDPETLYQKSSNSCAREMSA
jgi:fructose-bisphosphate aldolase class I